MKSPILIGILAALFFSSTFVINRMLGQASGHWYWTACLRYAHTVVFIVAWLLVSGKTSSLRRLVELFLDHWKFWTIAGTVGFGIFYTGICLSAAFAPGWVIATTWQTTILATPIVLHLFSKTPPKKSIAIVIFVFFGILLVNVEQFRSGTFHQFLWGAIPVLVAAFAYPVGNQMIWEASNSGFKRIPTISDPCLRNPIYKIFLMSLGTFPYWFLLGLSLKPSAPTALQIQNTAFVAVLSGLVATGLFFLARQMSQTSRDLTAVDSTQASEVIFTVLGENVFLSAHWPSVLGWIGMLLAMAGQFASFTASTSREFQARCRKNF